MRSTLVSARLGPCAATSSGWVRGSVSSDWTSTVSRWTAPRTGSASSGLTVARRPCLLSVETDEARQVSEAGQAGAVRPQPSLSPSDDPGPGEAEPHPGGGSPVPGPGSVEHPGHHDPLWPRLPGLER